MRDHPLFLVFLIIFFGVGCSLNGQSLAPVTWKSLDGKLESGYLHYLPKAIEKYDDLYLAGSVGKRTSKKYKTLLPLENVEWMIHAGDTIVQSLWYSGERYLAQPIYAGEAQLYRTIGKDSVYPYFFRYRGAMIPMGGEADVENITREIPIGDCDYYHPLKRLSSDNVAREQARQINHCLTQDDPRSEHTDTPARWRVGIGVNCWEEGRNNNRRSPGDLFAPTYLFRVPRLSLTVTHIPFRSIPGLALQLQIRSLNKRLNTNDALINGVPYRERSSIDNLYFYPGLGIETVKHRFFEPVLGVGAAIVMPLRFYRTFEFLDPQSAIPGYPVRQEIRNGQRASVGVFVNYGFRLNLSRQFSLGISGRLEVLEQVFAYTERNIAPSTNFFANNYYLAPKSITFLQFQVEHRW